MEKYNEDKSEIIMNLKMKLNRLNINWKKVTIYLAVFGFVFWLSAYGSFKVFTDTFTLAVPALTGRSLQEAELMLDDMALKLNITNEVYDREIPEGHVLEQSIAPGTQVKGHASIDIILSKGVESRLIPSLTGLLYDDVTEELTENEIYVSRLIRVHSDSVEEGVIIAQHPQPEEVSGEDLSLVVSMGSSDVTYYSPYFLGMAKMDALMLARDLGFSVRITELDSSSVISYQSPRPGAEINRGDVLKLRVGG